MLTRLTAQTKAQQEQQAQDADIKGKTIDMAKELIIHKADQQKAAHDQTMDKAKHGLDVGVAAHKAALDTHQAVLDTAEAMKPEPEPKRLEQQPPSRRKVRHDPANMGPIIESSATPD